MLAGPNLGWSSYAVITDKRIPIGFFLHAKAWSSISKAFGHFGSRRVQLNRSIDIRICAATAICFCDLEMRRLSFKFWVFFSTRVLFVYIVLRL